MGATALRPWPSGKKVTHENQLVYVGLSASPQVRVFHDYSILFSPPQICTHLANAQHTMRSIWWCAATVARWWSLKPLRNTVRGGMVLSLRCVDSLLLWLHSRDLALLALLQIIPPLERGRKMADVMKPAPQQHPWYTSTGLARPRRRQWGTVEDCLVHSNAGKVYYSDLGEFFILGIAAKFASFFLFYFLYCCFFSLTKAVRRHMWV